MLLITHVVTSSVMKQYCLNLMLTVDKIVQNNQCNMAKKRVEWEDQNQFQVCLIWFISLTANWLKIYDWKKIECLFQMTNL